MTHDDELIERVKDNIRDQALLVDTEVHDIALAAITVVRAYDAERRASVLDVAALVERYDPDDYRDLPVAMTEPVRFKGGLTEGKP